MRFVNNVYICAKKVGMNTKDFFLNRRTVRKYSNKPVSDELLTELLTQAEHAPTTGNMQLYSVVVTRDPERKKQLAPAHFNQPSVIGCSALLTFCADYNRFVRWCEISDATPGYDNFQSFVTAVLDTALFAQQFCTIAEMNGLGCCYLGTTTYNAPLISETLNLPELVVPVATIALGYPEGQTQVSDRLDVGAIMHNEVYKDYSDEDIKQAYAEKEAREDSKMFVKENGKRTLAQVFTDIRYTKASAIEFSKIYLDYIRKQGYKIPF